MIRDSLLRFAGEVNLKVVNLFSLNGTKINIANQIVSIEIYEDIFSAFTTADIVVSESVDFLNLFQFKGEEYIEVYLETPTTKYPIKNIFYVYKIANRIYTSEKEVTYTFKCISKEFVIDSNIKVRKSIYGNIETEAKKIVAEEGLQTQKSIITEKTVNNIKFVSNFWSPVKCLNYLANNAISVSASPSFLFFENRNGFNFVSVNTLLNGEVFQVFTKDNYTRDINASTGEITSYKNIYRDYSKIIELNMPAVTDYINAVQKGQVASKVISHDILTKRYHVKDYSLFTDKSVFNVMNKRLIHSDKALIDNSSKIDVIPRYYNNHMKYADNSDFKSLQRRNSFFENLKKHTVRIKVFGRTEYTVGLIVELNVPTVKEHTKKDLSTKDKMLSGKYIISAISHKIDHENHECNIELMKNSTID